MKGELDLHGGCKQFGFGCSRGEAGSGLSGYRSDGPAPCQRIGFEDGGCLPAASSCAPLLASTSATSACDLAETHVRWTLAASPRHQIPHFLPDSASLVLIMKRVTLRLDRRRLQDVKGDNVLRRKKGGKLWSPTLIQSFQDVKDLLLSAFGNKLETAR